MFIPVNEPLLDGNEKKYLNECIDTGWISSEGPFVERFEKEFAITVGRDHAIAVANGSGALNIAVAALEIGPGDEVILPSFTIISCAQAIVGTGATPVVVDSDPLTWNMDLAQVEAKITSRTRAIMAVHIYGLAVDMKAVLNLANKHGLKVIEDAAQAIGQTSGGRPCGSFGDISVFSFYPNKHITTGEGGMVVTSDRRLAERSRSLRNLCFMPGKRFVHEELGWNYRMTNMQAAIGCAQLEKLADHVQRKRRIGRRYNELLAALPLQLPLPKNEVSENIYWVYGVVIPDTLPFNADQVMARLAAEKISSRPFFWPMHEQPVFKKMGLFANQALPVAERLARRGFYLPSGLSLTDDQIHTVAQSLEKVLA